MITLLITLAAYYAITLTIGLVKTRRSTAAEYVVPLDTFGWLPTGVSLVGTVVGGGMFLGVAQLGFDSSLSAFALGVSYLAGSLVFGLLAPSIRRWARDHQVRTLFGVFEALYPSRGRQPSMEALFAGATLFVFFLMLAVQFVGVGSFLSFRAGINLPLAVAIGSAVVAVISTLIYSVVGGFKRDVLTDLFQVAAIIIGLVPLVLGLIDHDALDKVQSLPPETFRLESRHLIFFIGSLLFVAPTFLVRFDLWQRAIAAKTDTAARNAFWASGVASAIFFLFFSGVGLFGRALGLENSPHIGLEVISNVVPTHLLGLVLAAFFAAVMSSADTFLGVAGLALAKCTIYRKNELESAQDDKISVSRLRFLALSVGLVACAFAYLIRDIVDLFAAAYGILIVFLPALIGGIARKDPREMEARWSAILGLVTVVPLLFVIPTEAFLPGIVVSTATYLLLARKARRPRSGP